MATKKPTPKQKKAPANDGIEVTTPVAPTNSECIGELLHKLINNNEVDITIRSGTTQKEALVMRPLGYLDRIVIDTHLDYVKRECGTLVDNFGSAMASVSVQMIDIAYMSLYKRMKEGRFIRRFQTMEDAGKFLKPAEVAKLYDIYKESFQLSNKEKK